MSDALEPGQESVRDPGTAEPAWVDLAVNRPGAEAREQALALREQAPVMTFLARALGVKTEERSWRLGADGEELVASQLAKLGTQDPRWRFLYAVPVGKRGSDIDHVAIGPTGVFTINAKHHPRARVWVSSAGLYVNGSRTDYVRNSRFEAERAARLLAQQCGFPIPVSAVIAVVNADDFKVKQQSDGIHVTPRRQLRRWLRKRPEVLDQGQVSAIFEAARRSTTWVH